MRWLTVLAAVPLAFILGDHALARGGVDTPQLADADQFAANLTLQLGRVSSDTTSGDVAWSPARNFTLERKRSTRGWSTTLTLTNPEAPGTAPTTTPLGAGAIVRVEDSGEDAPVRMFDRAGREIVMPTDAEIDRWLPDTRKKGNASQIDAGDSNSRRGRSLLSRPARQRSTGLSWLSSVVNPVEGRGERGRRVQASMGRPRGRERGLDRYVAEDGGLQKELLFDAERAVPVEVNTAVNGVLQSHTTLSYEADVRGTLYRTGVRTERQDANNLRSRTVSQLKISNIRVGKGGGK